MTAAAIPWLIGAATAVSAVSAIQQSRAASRDAKAQAQAADFNAANAKLAAQEERKQALQRELFQRREANRVFGRQRAAIAQSGTGFGGSNLDILEQSAVAAEMDALTTRYEGELSARGLESQATLDTAEADQARRNARVYKTQGYLNAGGSILSGASAYGQYNYLKKRY